MGAPALAYTQRRADASPLWALVSDWGEAVERVWEERFEGKYGPWLPHWRRVLAGFLVCGDLACGFALSRPVVGARGRGGAAGPCVPAVGVHGAAGAQWRVHEGAAAAWGVGAHGVRRDEAVPGGAVPGREARRAVLRGGGGDLGVGRKPSSARSRAVLRGGARP